MTETASGRVLGEIGKGFLILLGVHRLDTEAQADRIADRICGLRVFEDENGKMNIGPGDAGAELLVVSQFTLWADCRSRAGRALPTPPAGYGRAPVRTGGAPVPGAGIPGRDGGLWRGHAGHVPERRTGDPDFRYKGVLNMLIKTIEVGFYRPTATW